MDKSNLGLGAGASWAGVAGVVAETLKRLGAPHEPADLEAALGDLVEAHDACLLAAKEMLRTDVAMILSVCSGVDTPSALERRQVLAREALTEANERHALAEASYMRIRTELLRTFASKKDVDAVLEGGEVR